MFHFAILNLHLFLRLFHYQKILKENNALDFDDLILETVSLFNNSPEVLEKYQNKFKYILIDEYQDTNQAQFILTKLLSKKSVNICVVGDFSQSIYSFRGANYRNLETFRHDFKDVKVFELSQNYRSTQKILDSAYSIISKNKGHPILKLWTENSSGENITIYEARNEHNEAEFIIEKIISESLSLTDVAVLYRTNAQSRVIEEVFLHQAVPYVLVGGTRFYERREIKDVLSYLRLVENPKDSISFKRVEKLGKARLSKFLEIQGQLKNEDLATIEILDQVLKKTEYLSLYDPKDAVTLMTLHGAKGLEFPAVFMVGMEEGIFPHSRSLMNKEELEEERRLCYVGMTRAKKMLFLTYTRRRLYFGQKTSNTVSRFISDLPIDLVNNNSGSSDVPDFL